MHYTLLFQNAVPVYVEETKAAAAAAPPVGTPNLFSPPSQEDIRTVYVPFENTVNVPSIYDVSVATSFGYNPNNPASAGAGGAGGKAKFPNFAAGAAANSPSYDNPISSYDAPIYNDNYSAKVYNVKTHVWNIQRSTGHFIGGSQTSGHFFTT